MLEWRALGVFMIFPTLTVAIYLAWKTRQAEEFFINLAICFWISANAYWMCCEFVHHPELKNLAGFPFVIGMLCVAIFYALRFRNRKNQADVMK